jgi:hypothetical protein
MTLHGRLSPDALHAMCASPNNSKAFSLRERRFGG